MDWQEIDNGVVRLSFGGGRVMLAGAETDGGYRWEERRMGWVTAWSQGYESLEAAKRGAEREVGMVRAAEAGELPEWAVG